jgi:hypothetical protein
MNNNQVLTALGKFLFFPRVKRVIEVESDEKYFKDYGEEDF